MSSLEWKSVIGYPQYAICEDGSVMRIVSSRTRGKAGDLVSPGVAGKGYLMVGLRDAPRARKFMYVHRLVALHFITKGDGNEVNHKDGNKRNNHRSNLEWVTRAENMSHAKATGLSVRGQRVKGARLTATLVEEIRARLQKGEKHKDIAVDYGVVRSTVSQIRRNANWRWVTAAERVTVVRS